MQTPKDPIIVTGFRNRVARIIRHPGFITGAIGSRVQYGIQYVRWALYRPFHRMPEIRIEEIAPTAMAPDDLIMDELCLPPYHGTRGHDDVRPLLHLVRHLRPKVVLEFGTAHGNTVANICRVSEARVVTVNALQEQMQGSYVTFTLARDAIGSVYRRYGFGERVTQVFTDTAQFDWKEHFDEPCVDLAIIDACHDRDYVLNDFHKVMPSLRPGATVLFHDTHPSMVNHLEGSYRACIQLRREGFDIRHITGTWWGIWQKKG